MSKLPERIKAVGVHLVDVIQDDRAIASCGTQELCGALVSRYNAFPELVKALEICLGHLTGGMDGNYADIDPIRLTLDLLEKLKEGGG